MNNVIEIKDLSKTYDKFKLDDINLNIPKGIIVGLIGENGAGKTTLIKSILNLINIDSGDIKIFGKSNKESDAIIKEDIGIVLDNMFFPEILNAKDINLIMKDIYKNWDSDLYFNYLEKFDIPLSKKIKDLSIGMRKKLEIITALVHKPKILILDEPTSGLDPVVRDEILDMFLEFIQDESNTILLSSHITSDLEHIADRIVFIDHGKLIMDNDKDEILDNYGILKCKKDDFKNISKEDIISYKTGKYEYQVLVSNRSKIKRKYKDYVIDKITLDELMVLIVKGEK